MSCILQCDDVVGESAVWCERRQSLFWVDIVGRRIHRFHTATGVHVVKVTAEMPTSIGLRNDDGAIVGFQRRVTLWDLEDRFETLALVEADQPDNRLNEGCVAPDGSFWVGTMQNNIDSRGDPLPISGASRRNLPDRQCGLSACADWSGVRDHKYFRLVERPVRDRRQHRECALCIRLGRRCRPDYPAQFYAAVSEGPSRRIMRRFGGVYLELPRRRGRLCGPLCTGRARGSGSLCGLQLSDQLHIRW